ncbi:MAG: hypothetical protein NTV03_01590 [Candidatus Nomurabacteria bacterium]|nr:hypothetical protein [Candidatus Nomurabacteria bacterium]
MEKPNLNIKPNQNFLGLILGLASIGFAEYFCLIWLFCFGIAVSLIFFISVCFTLYFYTIKYCKNKTL